MKNSHLKITYVGKPRRFTFQQVQASALPQLSTRRCACAPWPRPGHRCCARTASFTTGCLRCRPTALSRAWRSATTPWVSWTWKPTAPVPPAGLTPRCRARRQQIPQSKRQRTWPHSDCGCHTTQKASTVSARPPCEAATSCGVRCAVCGTTLFLAQPQQLRAVGVQLGLLFHEGIHLVHTHVDQLKAAFGGEFFHLGVVVELCPQLGDAFAHFGRR